jgi:hypothetical protein
MGRIDISIRRREKCILRPSGSGHTEGVEVRLPKCKGGEDFNTGGKVND